MPTSPFQAISAVTLGSHDMARAIDFYAAIGFDMKYGGADAGITSFYCGESFLNIVRVPQSKPIMWWGRVIFYVDDVDSMRKRFQQCGFAVETEPRDAEWGERYFHALDPDGHELSFAKLLG
ncbi:MAG: VOC family protein [Gammaproteobacteria bacterium]